MKKIFLWIGKTWHPLLLLAFALGLRIYIFMAMYPVIHSDSVSYFFLSELGTVRTPGYPLFIELILSVNDLFSFSGDYFKVLTFGQLFILGMLNSYLIYKITNFMTSNKIFSLMMGIIYNFNYVVIGFEFQIMTETLSITLLLAVILMYIQLFKTKKSIAIFAGLLSAFLLITRPIFLLWGLFLPFVTLIGFYPKPKKRKFLKKIVPALIIFFLMNIIVIGAWSLRNKIKFNYFGVSSLMPYQLRYYTDSFIDKYKPTDDEKLNKIAAIYAEELKKGRSSVTVYNFYQRIKEEMHLSDTEISKAFLKINLNLIKDYPSDYLKQVPKSIRKYYMQYSPYWTVRNSREFLNKKKIIPHVYLIFFNFYKNLYTNSFHLFFLIIIAPIGLFFMIYKKKKIFHGCLVIFFTIHYNCFICTLSTSAGIVNFRYRVAVEPLILIIFYLSLFFAAKCSFDYFRKRKRILKEANN
jgi:hypothetical protein